MLAPATDFILQRKGEKRSCISYCLNVNDMKASMKCLEEAFKSLSRKKI
jgi:hypothetical protein